MVALLLLLYVLTGIQEVLVPIIDFLYVDCLYNVCTSRVLSLFTVLSVEV